MEIRFAKEDELDRINELRKQVNDIHVEGKPDVFKSGFGAELQKFIHEIWNDTDKKIIVADNGEEIC